MLRMLSIAIIRKCHVVLARVILVVLLMLLLSLQVSLCNFIFVTMLILIHFCLIKNICISEEFKLCCVNCEFVLQGMESVIFPRDTKTKMEKERVRFGGLLL
jgi:hypothetical protein